MFHIICPICILSHTRYIACLRPSLQNVPAPLFPPESFGVDGGHSGGSLSSRDAETQPAKRADQSRDGEDDGTTKLRQEHAARAVWRGHHQQDQVRDSVTKVPKDLRDITLSSLGHGNQARNQEITCSDGSWFWSEPCLLVMKFGCSEIMHVSG